ncbi:carbohydrate esterase family 16 protein [Pseudohyphozyma bogoriensis]|nr:carbohydrate esterase family 16 protein [Pseudohyphozyma bogoriensis]
MGRPVLLWGLVWCALVAGQRVAAYQLAAMKDLFSFGDSYSSDEFDPSKGLNPVSGQHLETSSGGLNWIEYLVEACPAANNTWFDLAHHGATVDTKLVDSYDGNGKQVPSFVDQVDLFEELFAGKGKEIEWNSKTTLFMVWFGINDNTLGYHAGAHFPTLVPQILASYDRQISRLYSAGARNFLTLTIPPISRSPLVHSYTKSKGEELVEIIKTNVDLLNWELKEYWRAMPKKYEGTEVVVVDAHALFNKIMDSPKAFGLKEAEYFCPEYADVIDDPEIFHKRCVYPMKEFFWHDSIHPTWPVHREITKLVVQTVARVDASSTVPSTKTSISQLSVKTSSSAIDIGLHPTIAAASADL